MFHAEGKPYLPLHKTHAIRRNELRGADFVAKPNSLGRLIRRGRCGDAVQSTAKPYARFVTNRLPKRARSPAMAVIDVHAHIYPEKIAERAVGRRGRVLPRGHVRARARRHTCWHLEGAARPSRTSSCTRWPPNPAPWPAINDFIAAQCRLHPEFIGFMAMHQDLADPETEIERAVGLGLRRHEAASRHPEGEHGRPAPHAHLRDDRGSAAAHRAHGRLPHRFLASAPAQEHPAHVPQPRGGRGALRRLVRSPRSATTCCTRRTCSSTCPAP